MATLARKHKAQEISSHDFDAKLAEIDRDWRYFVKIELTADGLGQARDSAARLALRGADAVHFGALQALRQKASGSGHEVILVVADRELKEAAAAAGYAVLVPGDEPGV